MSRFIVIVLSMLVAFASAFAPMRSVRAPVAKMTQMNMSPADVAVEATNVLSQLSQTLAGETDFGGYAGPAGSLIFIGILIVALAPPLAPKE